MQGSRKLSSMRAIDTMERSNSIPTVDMSPFFCQSASDSPKAAMAAAAIMDCCRSYGFFRVINHGVPHQLMARALELSREYFLLPDEEKLKGESKQAAAGFTIPMTTGYLRSPATSPDTKENFYVLSPELGLNVDPAEPPEFRSVLDDCFAHLRKMALMMQDIINDGMSLPVNFFKEYNNDRSSDFMVALKYPPATKEENIGISQHQDANCLTFAFQEDVQGLEFLKDAQWIPADPIEGAITVNIGDIFQVLTNDRLQSPVHSVLRKEKDRCAFAFFLNVSGDRWVEPLTQFTTKIGEPPRYRRFLHKEYMQLRYRNKAHPPLQPEDFIDISHYAIDP